MKTAQEWNDSRWELFEKGVSMKEWISKIQTDAFAAGERKGRVQQLREIASRPDVRSSLGRIFIRMADRLEREEEVEK